MPILTWNGTSLSAGTPTLIAHWTNAGGAQNDGAIAAGFYSAPSCNNRALLLADGSVLLPASYYIAGGSTKLSSLLWKGIGPDYTAWSIYATIADADTLNPTLAADMQGSFTETELTALPGGSIAALIRNDDSGCLWGCSCNDGVGLAWTTPQPTCMTWRTGKPTVARMACGLSVLVTRQIFPRDAAWRFRAVGQLQGHGPVYLAQRRCDVGPGLDFDPDSLRQQLLRRGDLARPESRPAGLQHFAARRQLFARLRLRGGFRGKRANRSRPDAASSRGRRAEARAGRRGGDGQCNGQPGCGRQRNRQCRRLFTIPPASTRPDPSATAMSRSSRHGAVRNPDGSPITIAVTDENGNPIDLAGRSLRMNVYEPNHPLYVLWVWTTDDALQRRRQHPLDRRRRDAHRRGGLPAPT